MKNRKFYAILAMIMLFACSFATAQTESYLNLGLSMPTGRFADGDADEFALMMEAKEGGAGIGANLGFKFKFPTKAKGLGILLSVDGIYNGLNKDLKETFEDLLDELEDEYDDVTLRRPNYINVPLMAGLNYCYDVNDNLGIYGEAAVGANARFITNFYVKGEASGNDPYYGHFSAEETMTYEYDPAISFAFQLGAGLKINNKFTIGINFYNLGEAKVKGKVSEKYKQTVDGDLFTDSDKENFKLKSLSSTMVLLRFGIKL